MDQGGARIAIIMNGSPLFTGDAGSGESEIRRFVFENDLLEALIALPEQLFYNTGIATYVWLLTNYKDGETRTRPAGVRDQLQPLFLPVQAATAHCGDRSGYPGHQG